MALQPSLELTIMLEGQQNAIGVIDIQFSVGFNDNNDSKNVIQAEFKYTSLRQQLTTKLPQTLPAQFGFVVQGVLLTPTQETERLVSVNRTTITSTLSQPAGSTDTNATTMISTKPHSLYIITIRDLNKPRNAQFPCAPQEVEFHSHQTFLEQQESPKPIDDQLFFAQEDTNRMPLDVKLEEDAVNSMFSSGEQFKAREQELIDLVNMVKKKVNPTVKVLIKEREKRHSELVILRQQVKAHKTDVDFLRAELQSRKAELEAFRLKEELYREREEMEKVYGVVLDGLGVVENQSKLTLNKGDAVNIDTIRAIANSKRTESLSELVLAGTSMGDDEVAVIAKALSFENLFKLNLQSNNITDFGAKELANSTQLESLARLDLRGNSGIGKVGWMALKRSEKPFLSLLVDGFDFEDDIEKGEDDS